MAIEILEQRLAPAGIVVATVSNGVLTLTGDALDNAVTVTEFAPDQFRITGSNGTEISYNGSTGAEVEIAGVGKGITADFKAGSDGLVLEGVSLSGNLAVQMGAGALNTIQLTGGTEIGGNLTLTGGAGDDVFTVDGQLTVNGSTTLNLGDGANGVVFGNTGGSLDLAKGLTINAGTGDDNVQVLSADGVDITGSVNFNLGGGANAVVIETAAVGITGGLNVTHAAHAAPLATNFSLLVDTLTVGGGLTVTSAGGDNGVFILAGDFINIAGSVNIQNGEGNSSVQITAENFIRVGGSLSLTNAGPNTAGFTQIQAPLVTVGGNFTMTHGSGLMNSDLSSGDNANTGLLNVGGNLAISFGGNTTEGASVNLIAFQEIQVGGKLSVTTGNGLYVHTIDAAHLEAGGGISIVNGNVVPRGAEGFYETVTYLNATTLLAPSLSISNGNGNFTTGVTSSLAQITGDLTLRNGDGNAHTNSIEGAFAIGGNLRVINGWGGNVTNLTSTGTLTVGGDLTIDQISTRPNAAGRVSFMGGRFEVGDDLTIRYSNGDAETNFTTQEVIVGDDFSLIQGNAGTAGTITGLITPEDTLSVGGDLLIRAGSGATFRHVISSANVSIAGDVTVNYMRNAGSSVEFDGGSIAIGGRLTVTNLYGFGGSAGLSLTGGDYTIGRGIHFMNGVSMDTLAITVDSLNVVNGDIRVRGGPGDTTTTIEANRFNLGGNLNIAGGAGNDVLSIRANGRLSGSINAAFGTGASNAVTLGDAVEGGTGLTIAGTVNVAADYAGTRTLDVGDVTFLSLFRFTGGNAADLFMINDSQFTKGAYFNLQAGDDEFYLQSSSFSGAFTLLAGAGADVAEMGNSNDFPGALNFRGVTSIRMEGGDDRLVIGGEAPVTFFQRTTLDGGPGTDRLLMAGGVDAPVFLGGAPTVINFELFEDEE